MTGFAVTLLPSLSVALELQNRATGQDYVVSKSLPKLTKISALLMFVRLGSEAVRLGRAENVPGWNWEVAPVPVEIKPVHVPVKCFVCESVECRGECSPLWRK